MKSWIVVLGVVGTQACLFEPQGTPIDLHMFRCSQAGQAECTTPGDEIQSGTLPPSNEAFLVVAKYKGASSRFTLSYPSIYAGGFDSMVVEITSTDSASVWVNLDGAKDGLYVERVTGDQSVPDSLVWDYGWRRSNAPTAQREPVMRAAR